jgi:hypothetical protein
MYHCLHQKPLFGKLTPTSNSMKTIKCYFKNPNADYSDPSAYESYDDVIERLNYFRKLSGSGFQNLSDRENYEFVKMLGDFFPSIVGLHRTIDSRASSLYRASVIKNITGSNTQLLTKISQLTAPPAKLVKIGRCNFGGGSNVLRIFTF